MDKLSKLALNFMALAFPLLGSQSCQTETVPKWSSMYEKEFVNSFKTEDNMIEYVAETKFKRSFYVDTMNGKDTNDGKSPKSAFKTLDRVQEVGIMPGDQILLKGGLEYSGCIELNNIEPNGTHRIHIGSYGYGKATINAFGLPYGIMLCNTSFVDISDLKFTANGGPADKGYMLREQDKNKTYRYGIYAASEGEPMSNINITNCDLSEIYYYNPNDTQIPDYRPCREWSTNNESNYGWGIRMLSHSKNGGIDNVNIKDCHIKNLSHTGIKINGNLNTPISNLLIEDCSIINAGGPGSQFSGVKHGVMRRSKTVRSGSRDDARKWGRGSGMWTYSCDDFLFEHNYYERAEGIADCCGAHIDIGNRDVVIQYCMSVDNAGGFVEILGKNYNCAYRYNISINDGWRNPKDQTQESHWRWTKIEKDPKGKETTKTIGTNGCLITINGHTQTHYVGPYQSYVYNNTIVCTDNRQDGFTNPFIYELATSAEGILVANNLFWVPQKMGKSWSGHLVEDGEIHSKSVNFTTPTGELNKDKTFAFSRDMNKEEIEALDFVMTNNLYRLYNPKFLRAENALPDNVSEGNGSKMTYWDESPKGGNPMFMGTEMIQAEDLVPTNAQAIYQGIEIPKLKSDKTAYGVLPGLKIDEDFFGNKITKPIIGACVPL